MSHKKRFILVTILALLIVGLVGFHSAKAYAYTVVYYTDNFDTASNWRCEAYFSGTGCGVVTNASFARSVSNYGSVSVDETTATSYWAGLGRTITLTAPAGYPTLGSCSAVIWLLDESGVWGNYGEWTSGNGSGQLEIINPTNWTYITAAPFTLSPKSWTFNNVSSGYQAVQSGYFYPAAGSSIYLRLVADAPASVAYGSQALTSFYIDDMKVICQFLG